MDTLKEMLKSEDKSSVEFARMISTTECISILDEIIEEGDGCKTEDSDTHIYSLVIKNKIVVIIINPTYAKLIESTGKITESVYLDEIKFAIVDSNHYSFRIRSYELIEQEGNSLKEKILNIITNKINTYNKIW